MRDIFEIRAKKERKGYRFELFGGGGGVWWRWGNSSLKKKIRKLEGTQTPKHKRIL